MKFTGIALASFLGSAVAFPAFPGFASSSSVATPTPSSSPAFEKRDIYTPSSSASITPSSSSVVPGASVTPLILDNLNKRQFSFTPISSASITPSSSSVAASSTASAVPIAKRQYASSVSVFIPSSSSASISPSSSATPSATPLPIAVEPVRRQYDAPSSSSATPSSSAGAYFYA